MLSGVSTGINTLPAMPKRHGSDAEVNAAGYDGKIKKANPQALALMMNNTKSRKDHGHGTQWVPVGN